jgi:6-methylsalicylate decarboxylase
MGTVTCGRKGVICDVHSRYIPKRFSDFMGDRFTSTIGAPKPTGIARHPVPDSATDIRGLLELMDAAGVEKQILSPHRQPYLPDEAECVKALHLLNDGSAELAHRYPNRIASYVMLPLPHIDASGGPQRLSGAAGLGGVSRNVCVYRPGRVAGRCYEPHPSP